MAQLVLEGDRAHATKLGSDPTNRLIFDAIHDVLPLIRERMVSANERPRRDITTIALLLKPRPRAQILY